MNNAPAKLKKLKELMDITTEGLTRAEFLESFQKVIDYAKKIKGNNEQEWSLIHSAFQMLADKHEKLIKGKFDAAHVEHSSKISKALKEQEIGMKAVYDRAARLPEKGDKGDKGDDAVVDHDKIVADVVAKIPKPKDGYTPVKGKDYWDGKKGDPGHSSAAPHPMRVQDLSAKTDGTTKTFTVPKSTSSIIHMSDFPYVLAEGNGYTFNANRTQITLTVQNAPTANSQFIFQYASMFNLPT